MKAWQWRAASLIWCLAAPAVAQAANMGEFVPGGSEASPPPGRVQAPRHGHVMGPGAPEGGFKGNAPAGTSEWRPGSPSERLHSVSDPREGALKQASGGPRPGSQAKPQAALGGRFESGPPMTTQPNAPKPPTVGR